jgi:hypothetical protein
VLFQCLDLESSLTAIALSAFVDLYLAVYPAVILAQLQMNIKKKTALGVALGIGSVSCVVAAYKCTQLPSLASDDFSCEYTNSHWIIVSTLTCPVQIIPQIS